MPERREGGLELSEDGFELGVELGDAGELIPAATRTSTTTTVSPFQTLPPSQTIGGKLKFTKNLQIRSDQPQNQVKFTCTWFISICDRLRDLNFPGTPGNFAPSGARVAQGPVETLPGRY